MFDLDRELEGDCTLEFLKFEDDEGNINFLIFSLSDVKFLCLHKTYIGINVLLAEIPLQCKNSVSFITLSIE